MQIPLQIGREQTANRVADNKSARHPPACRQRVAEQAAFEDAEKRQSDFTLLCALQLAILEPDCRFFDKEPDVDEQQCRQDAEDQQTAPADRIVQKAIGGRSEEHTSELQSQS